MKVRVSGVNARVALVSVMAVMAVLTVAPVASADDWFSDPQQAQVRVSPDLADRVSAAQQLALASMLDSRERSLGAKVETLAVSPIEQRERAFAAKREAQLAVHRATEPAQSSIRAPVVDDRFRIDHSAVPAPVSATSTDNHLEWPQIGIGFAFGIVLMLSVYMTLKATRPGSPAH